MKPNAKLVEKTLKKFEKEFQWYENKNITTFVVTDEITSLMLKSWIKIIKRYDLFIGITEKEEYKIKITVIN